MRMNMKMRFLKTLQTAFYDAILSLIEFIVFHCDIELH